MRFSRLKSSFLRLLSINVDVICIKNNDLPIFYFLLVLKMPFKVKKILWIYTLLCNCFCFRAIHVPESDRWALRIEAAKLSDEGGYECQVTTTNKTVLVVYLTVLGKPRLQVHLRVNYILLFVTLICIERKRFLKMGSFCPRFW